MHSAQEEANLALVRRVYAECLGPIDSGAVSGLFREDYIQHSPLAETGAQGLRDFLDWAKGASPGATHEVKRMFADGDHVIAHVHVVIVPGTPGNSVIDIFRIENGKVAEHWDASQPIDPNPKNGNGVF